MVNTITLAGKQSYAYMPNNYNPQIPYPCLIFLPGLGETVGALTQLNVHGPFLYLNANSSVDLGLDIIVIAIQPNSTYGIEVADCQAYLNAIKAAYKISHFGVTGLSLGCQEWMNFAWNGASNFAQISAFFMFSADPPNQPPYGTAVVTPSLFASQNSFYYGGCGTSDGFYYGQYSLYQSIMATKPALTPAWDSWPGVGHSDPVWSNGYNPAWKSPSMGVSIYQKFASLYPIQQVTPVTYSNIVTSNPFTRNNCGVGYTSSTVTYTVPAGKYTSTVSQAAANALATADITANGQAYANLNGTCSIIPVFPTSLPQATTAQKLAIVAPKAGMTLFDITLDQISYFNGSTWINV